MRLDLGETLATSDEFFPIRYGYVYALVDGDEPERVRYVGSSWDAIGRFSFHIFQPQALVAPWIAEIRAKNGRVLLRALARSTDRNEMFRIEQAQLDAYRAIGQADLNSFGTRPVSHCK